MVEGAGVSIAVERWSDDGCDAVFVHANGFCKETLHPLAHDVVRRVPDTAVWLMDLRGHGESGRGEPPYNMPRFGEDVAAVMADVTSKPVGVGHSSGGTAVAVAQLLRPSLFSALVLVEPIIMPPPFERRWNPLVQLAERRRRSFPSRESARNRFASGAFATWTDEALDAYIDHGFSDVDGEWVLRCAPEVEADVYYEGSNHDTWERIHAIEVPVVVVTGEYSTSHQGVYLDALLEQFACPEVVVVPGAGHLVPMEKPDAVGEVVASVLNAVP